MQSASPRLTAVCSALLLWSLASSNAAAQPAEVLIGLDLPHWWAGAVYSGAVAGEGMDVSRLVLTPAPGRGIGVSLEVRSDSSPWLAGMQAMRIGTAATAVLCVTTEQCWETDVPLKLRQLSAYGGRVLWRTADFEADAGVTMGFDHVWLRNLAAESQGWGARGGVTVGARFISGSSALVVRGDAGRVWTNPAALGAVLPPGVTMSEPRWFPLYRLTVVLQLNLMRFAQSQVNGLGS